MSRSETESPIDNEQLEIGGSYKSVHLTNAAFYRKLLSSTLISNGVSQGRIAEETERDTTTVSLMLSGRQAMAMDVFAAILTTDSLGTFLAGLCRRLGYEEPRKRGPDLAAENQRLRMKLARIQAEMAEDVP